MRLGNNHEASHGKRCAIRFTHHGGSSFILAVGAKNAETETVALSSRVVNSLSHITLA